MKPAGSSGRSPGKATWISGRVVARPMSSSEARNLNGAIVWLRGVSRLISFVREVCAKEEKRVRQNNRQSDVLLISMIQFCKKDTNLKIVQNNVHRLTFYVPFLAFISQVKLR